MSMNGVHNSLAVTVCSNADAAIKDGHVYREPTHEPIRIEKVVVVKGGMESGRATVDVVLVDKRGQKYACMLPMTLLKSVTNLTD